MKILSADYVLPISSEPIENGAIVIEKDKIIAVGKYSELNEKFHNAKSEYFNEAVLMPGFVNCHSHLEITAMRGFLDDSDGDFYTWLMTLTRTRADILTENDIKNSAIFGALEGARAGITCFADIGRLGKAGFEALKINGLRGILFQETDFSPKNETSSEDFQRLKEKFYELKETETDLVKVGISPHSPYTVSQKLFEKITEFALAENVKISIHAAESVDEDDFLKKGTGFFSGLYERFNLEWNAPQLSPVEYLHNIGVLRAEPLLAHCVKVSEKDIKLIAESGSRIAHCPKSNAKFGHGVAPFARFLEENIKIGFGSDSMASNNTCDILEESRFAVLLARTIEEKKEFLHAEKIIETATLGGARAIGLENEIGSLEVGKQADVIAVSLTNSAQIPVHNVYNTLLFATNSCDVIMTMVAGEEIFRENSVKRVDEAEVKAKMKEIAVKMKV